MTVTMPSITWMLIMTSLWMTETKAQKECEMDADCAVGQYCYEISKMCVDYILCRWYNRQESSRPSRHPSQCGRCKEGFSASKLTFGLSEEAESCTKDPEAVEVNNQSNLTAIWVSGSIIFGFLFFSGSFLYAVYVKSPYKLLSKVRPRSDKEKPSSMTAEDSKSASVPLTSDSSENIKNDKYNDAEETNPFSTAKEYSCSFTVESSHPVKARGTHAPDWVRTDPSYDPGDNQIVEAAFSPIPDEEIHSGISTPGLPTEMVIITTLPSTAIAQVESDNTTNIALETMALTSPLSSRGGRAGEGNNNSSDNPGEFESNNANGNRSGNSSSISIVQMVKLYGNFNQNRNGSL